jgi:SAM-dependent methyltransferase
MSDADREKWNARYRAGSHGSTEASPFLRSLADRLPASGKALDIAGGAGRNALWLAARGLDVTVTDISDEGLAIAARRASAAGSPLTTLRLDLERDPLPRGPWDLVVWMLYLRRELFAGVADVLAPGGLFVFLQPTTTNLQRHAKPPRDFLLRPGEVGSLLVGLDVLTLDEGWSVDGFHEARVLAHRPMD